MGRAFERQTTCLANFDPFERGDDHQKILYQVSENYLARLRYFNKALKRRPVRSAYRKVESASITSYPLHLAITTQLEHRHVEPIYRP